MKNLIPKCTFYYVLFFLLSSHSNAANLSISNVPLYLGGSVEPNVMFTIDDSGSMQFEVMPDNIRYYAYYLFPFPTNQIYGGDTYTSYIPTFSDNNVHNFFLRSPNNNKIFYNPDITYQPWGNADGTVMGNANPKNALFNPKNTSEGSIDLTVKQSIRGCWYYHSSSLNNRSTYCDNYYSRTTYYPITYYLYKGSESDSQSLKLDSNRYTKIQITESTSSSTKFVSPNGTERTRDQEIQNFANWFQYYRSRTLTARAGVGRAFASQSSNMRVGFAAINQGSKTIDGVQSNSAIIKGLRTFSGANRTDFFNRLYTHTIPQKGTPLRSAASSVGKYFERTDNPGPWGKTPGTDDSTPQLTCRQSYNILMTDGYWNGSSPSVGNVDGTNGSVITGPNNDDYQYFAGPPYTDSWSNTLADVAMYYWNRDLRTDLENEVPTNSQDPAFWQHLVTFTVGLGVNGTLNDSDYADLQDGTTQWPKPSDDSEKNIDDLWHAAVNSRGSFFSASDPDTFAESLANILSNISSRTSSSASVALSTGSVTTDTNIYQVRFNSGDWTGQLVSYEVDVNGQLDGIAWEASDELPSASSRRIITFDGTSAQPFQWDSLTPSQQSVLGEREILDYIRGDQSNESNNSGSYRNRNSLLGDIINSAPTYVAKPASNYSDDWGATGTKDQPEDNKPYSNFLIAKKDRQPLIYVGANDGMLHAFIADKSGVDPTGDEGKEKFAYIPSFILGKLPLLTNPDYTHEYFVDASPNAYDAFFDNSWHTVLVSGTGAGGQGYFAIDVTTPNDFSTESSAASKVLWEFSDRDDADMGYSMGQASIIRLNNGEWAALFSSGYNNTYDNDADGNTTNDSMTGNGVIYLVNIKTGTLIKKFDTQVGSAEDPTGQGRPNGIATPTAIDINSDGIVDAVYAGDLFGNVWSIKLNGDDVDEWDFAYYSDNKPAAIFTACHGSSCNVNNIQPITTRIQVVDHPTENGFILLFGTGKYFEVGDNSATNQVTQSFYGIWDQRLSTLNKPTRNKLLEQTILQEVSINDNNYRISSDNKIKWGYDTGSGTYQGWYVDLLTTTQNVDGIITSSNYGERQVSTALIRGDRVIFTTLLPSDDECAYGGSGWLMELNYTSGSRLNYSPLDVNGDGEFSKDDYYYIDTDGDEQPDTYIPVSGQKSTSGLISSPTTSRLLSDTNKEIKYISNSDGTIDVIVENAAKATGRASWRQLSN